MKKIIISLTISLLMALPHLAYAAEVYPNVRADANTWDRAEGYAEHAIDRNEGTIWHSLWNLEAAGEGFESQEGIFPQYLVIELDEVYDINRAGYFPRADYGNGVMVSYRLWVSQTEGINDNSDYSSDEKWQMVSQEQGITCPANEYYYIDFDSVKAKSVKLEMLDGFGGWASCAELQLGFAQRDIEPYGSFEPRAIGSAENSEAGIGEQIVSDSEQGKYVKSNAPLIVAIICAVVIIAMIGLMIYVNLHREKSK